ncbi:two-component regulator propeller domain-containing protein [Hyalangium rubrum]|uniref:histidine kinase n=1 Tax=Hyalangium rubrum TaxID=3103134 RepID=A0ABU5GYC9_9BACT|nr:two-component regulator propeller domain-containing protein [Hyalangium sp. s54d21]MDY7226051.1 two-component regulator propeller domain-containing protein [Hyalangium sp. s54d21]
MLDTVPSMGTRRRRPERSALLGLWWVVLLGVGAPGLALEPARRISQYSHDNWRSENGLPQNSGLALAQTSEGYLWIGTYEGLVRFDGARFTTFDRRTSPEMEVNTVSALVEDAEGTLWVGTARGLFRHEQGQLRPLPDAGELAHAGILQLLADGKQVWVASNRGLERIPVAGQGTRRRFNAQDGLPDNHVRALARSGEEGIWVGTVQGLARVSGDTVEALVLPLGESPLVESLLETRDGTLWIGTDVGLVSLREGQFTSYGPAQGVPRQPVTTLLEDRDGTLWVATELGLLRRTPTGFAPVALAHLATDRIHSLLEDREGSLWVGTDHDGISRLSTGPFFSIGEPEGSTLGSTSFVLETRDGTQWVGALRRGLERIQGGVVTRMGPEHGLDDETIYSLAEGPDGALWASTGSGAFRYDGQRFARLGTSQGMPPGLVMGMAADASGGMWLSTLSGLALLRDGRVTLYGKEHGFVPETIMPMLVENSGTVWYGTHAGVVRFAQGTFTRFTTKDGLAGDAVMSLHADANGTLWVGTTAGLSRLKDGRVVSITLKQGLPENSIFTLLLDAEDHFWMSSNKGVARVSRRELEEVADGRRARVRASFFDDRDGMRISECNGGPQPAGWLARDGRMWFSSVRGVVGVDPKDARLNSRPPQLHIEELRVQGQPVPMTHALELAPGQEDLEVRFTAFAPRGGERLSFRYRLEGYDSGWVEAEGRRAATYTRLPPGHYHFEVTTLDREGRWVEPPALVEVTLRPWFYQTWWFYVLSGLAVCGVAASGYAWRVGRLKQRERWLQSRVQERTQELARANHELDAHLRELRAAQAQLVQAGKMAAVGTLAAGVGHEINNPLSYIVSNLEHACEEAVAMERLEEGSESSRARLREMQQVLREALMGADRVRRIVRDLKTFSRQDDDTSGPVDLRVVLDSAAKMAAGELRPRAQLVRDYAVDVPLAQGNEARLAQVFLNLIINAAQALPEGRPEQNEVRLVLKRGGAGQVVAEVRDTGSGISPEVLGRIFDPFFTTKPVGVGTGLGLALCQAFVTSMSGKIEVDSEVGRGTVVRVVLPASSVSVVRKPQAAPAEAGAPVRGRLLVVDDDPLVSAAVRRTLAREHDVEVVVSSRRALEMLTSPAGDYDVILCDLMMPEMTGMELHAQLAAAAPARAQRMVFITGGAYTPVARTFLERVLNARVEKPFEPDKLREQVRGWVTQAREGSSGRAA